MLRPIGILDPSKPFVFNVQVHPNEWLIINIQAAYFYLVNYDETNWKRLSNALNSKNFEKIPPLTRGKLLYDAFTLARFGKLKYSVALSLIKYLEREKDYIALDSFFYVFDFFYTNFAGLKDFHYLQVSVYPTNIDLLKLKIFIFCYKIKSSFLIMTFSTFEIYLKLYSENF